MINVIPFTYEDRPLRVITHDDGSWCVVAKDVVEGLGGKWSGRFSIAHIPEQWRMVLPVRTIQGEKQTQCLTEQGLYFLLGRSDKPKALPYQMWIAGEVVPTIRRTGEYRQTYDGAAVLQGIDRLGTKLDLLTATCHDTHRCVEGFADNQRSKFHPDTMRDVCNCTLRFYSGKCPNCMEIVVVDSGGNRLAIGEFDHANGRQNNDRKNCWLVCVDCHRLLKVQDYRIKRMPKFLAFQLDLDRYSAPLLNPPPSRIELVQPPVQLAIPPSAAAEIETPPEMAIEAADDDPPKRGRGRPPDSFYIRRAGRIADLFGAP